MWVKVFGTGVQDLRIGQNSKQPSCLSSLRYSDWLRDGFWISPEERQTIEPFGTRSLASNFTRHAEQRIFLTTLLFNHLPAEGWLGLEQILWSLRLYPVYFPLCTICSQTGLQLHQLQSRLPWPKVRIAALVPCLPPVNSHLTQRSLPVCCIPWNSHLLCCRDGQALSSYTMLTLSLPSALLSFVLLCGLHLAQFKGQGKVKAVAVSLALPSATLLRPVSTPASAFISPAPRSPSRHLALGTFGSCSSNYSGVNSFPGTMRRCWELACQSLQPTFCQGGGSREGGLQWYCTAVLHKHRHILYEKMKAVFLFTRIQQCPEGSHE